MSLPVDPLDALIGEVLLDRFLVDEVLGEGGFCRVFHARTRQGREIAVKVLKTPSPRAVMRHQREVTVLKGLPPNPHVAAYVADGHTADGVPILVCEYVDGATLKVVIRRMGAAAERRAAALVAQICGALLDLHLLGVVHRDVKPSNVLLSRAGTIKLIDFGLVLDAQGVMGLLESDTAPQAERFFDSEIDRGVLAGTLSYMAPEQFSDALIEDPTQTRTSTAADVYSLGVVLYELLSGRPPVKLDAPPRGGDDSALFEEMILRRLRNGDDHILPLAGVDRALASIVFKALRFDPDRRHPSARELEAELIGFLSQGSGAIPLPTARTEQVILPEHRAGEATETWPRADGSSTSTGDREELTELTRPFFDRTGAEEEGLDEVTQKLPRSKTA